MYQKVKIYCEINLCIYSSKAGREQKLLHQFHFYGIKMSNQEPYRIICITKEYQKVNT